MTPENKKALQNELSGSRKLHKIASRGLLVFLPYSTQAYKGVHGAEIATLREIKLLGLQGESGVLQPKRRKPGPEVTAWAFKIPLMQLEAQLYIPLSLLFEETDRAIA